MQLAQDLDLAHVPMEDDRFAEDPNPYLAAARRQHPWLARCSVGYFVTEYQAIKDIYYQDAKLRFPGDQIVDLMGAQDTGWGRFTEEMMLSRSGAEHDRLRGSVAEAFTPRAVNRLRPLMRQVVSDLLDEWAPKGGFNFAEFAANFPIRVMFGLIGADPEPLPQIQWALEVHGSSFGLDPTRMETIESAYQVLWNFVDGLIVERGPQGGHDDLLDDLIAANTGGQLSDVELRQMLVFLFGAGYDTSKNLLTLIMNSMLNDPPLWARCADERPFCDKVVEEGLRHTSPSNPYRLVVEDLEYRDVRFPAGSLLVFPLAIAGRDEASFPEPMAFNPDRTHTNRHIAFGRGMHLCLGQYLARAQLEEGLHLMAQRITNPRRAGKIAWRPFPGVWGLTSLPIAFDPAPLRPAEATQAGGEARGCPISSAGR
jgi:cytochrome P450